MANALDSVYLNIVVLIIASLFLIKSYFSSPRPPDILVKLLGVDALCIASIFILGAMWGYEFFDLLTLQTSDGSGIVVGGMYGCLIGTGISYLKSLQDKKRGMM